MDPKQYDVLAVRVGALETQMQTMNTKMDRLLAVFERGSGAWWLLKWLGGLVVGAAAIWAAVGDHIHWR